MVKTFVLVGFVTGFAMLSTGCSQQKSDNTVDNGKLQVAATIFPVGDWVKQVGGDDVRVTTLLAGGNSPHTFEPTPAELRRIANAKVMFKAGLKLDDWAMRLTQVAKEEIKVISLGDELANAGVLPDVEHVLHIETTQEKDEHAHDHEARNPHFWLDPSLAKWSANRIAEELGKIDPERASKYRERAEAYSRELAALDKQLSDTLKAVAGKPFLTVHNAFPYFTHRYNLSLAGVIEEYAGKEPSDRYLKQLTSESRKLGVAAVFTEPQLSPRVAQALSAEVGARVGILDPSGSESIPERNSYIKLLQFNAEKLTATLK